MFDLRELPAALGRSVKAHLPHRSAEPRPGRYDVVIVGGGSAGCVLAARLSEDAGRQVLLLEAGPAYPADGYPADLTTAGMAAIEPFRSWGYVASPGRTGHELRAHAGRVLGGGSAVNGGISRRARPADFARWIQHGLPEWSFDNVLPAYRSLERTSDGEDRWHGRTGPWPIDQSAPDRFPDPVKAFIEAAVAAGLSKIDDANDPEQPGGAGGETRNVIDGIRHNTAMTYLTKPVRARPNLTIRSDVTVDRLALADGQADGVFLLDGEKIEAAEVIISAGVYGSPAILLRSGIGPSAHLQALGIDMVADLPVGERLSDQPMYVLRYPLPPGTATPASDGSGLVWTASSEAVEGELDLQLSISMQPDFGPDGVPTLALSVWAIVVAPRSIGTVRLKSRDPRITPMIDYALLSDDADRRRLNEAVALARDIVSRQPVAGMVVDEWLRGPGVSAADLDEAIRFGLTTFLHGTSSVPMGGPDDPGAVVDAWGRVRGLHGLRVVDASIFPEAVSVPSNLTVIMVAERIAAAMAAEHHATAATSGASS